MSNKLACEIVDIFDDLLHNKNIKIPCDDKDEENERNYDASNEASLYGMEYWNLVDKIEPLIFPKENLKTVENYLYNSILAWYDDSFSMYNGIDDPLFVTKVCEETGISQEDYKILMNGNAEECSWNK